MQVSWFKSANNNCLKFLGVCLAQCSNIATSTTQVVAIFFFRKFVVTNNYGAITLAITTMFYTLLWQ